MNPIHLDLNHSFIAKPLLIGGKAMEYYDLRPAGRDIDFVVTAEDYTDLAAKYPDHVVDLYGDLGVCVGKFELWKCILLFDYEFLSVGAVEESNYKVISLERLLLLKALGIKEAKYERDLRLIVKKIHDIQYGKDAKFPANYFHS